MIDVEVVYKTTMSVFEFPESEPILQILCWKKLIEWYLHRVIVLYKNNYIDAEHDMSATFVKKVFSSWDFSITEKKAANIKHRSIYNELKVSFEQT